MPYRAGFWIRALATAIDVVIMLIIAAAVGMAMQPTVPTASAWARQSVVYVAWLGFTSMEIWTAATPGKMVVRLSITEQDCSPAEFWRRVLRWSTKQFWLMAYLCVPGVGVIGAEPAERLQFDDRHDRLPVCRER